MTFTGAHKVTISVALCAVCSCTQPTETETIIEQPAEDEQLECVPLEPIAQWTVRVVDTACIWFSHTWDAPVDWNEYDRVDREFTWLQDYLMGWAVKHNIDNGTEWIVEYRRDR